MVVLLGRSEQRRRCALRYVELLSDAGRLVLHPARDPGASFWSPRFVVVDGGDIRMALARKQLDLGKGHFQPCMTKEAPCLEKRQQPRFTSQFRSTISGGQGEGLGRTLDLSVGGCMIETDLPVVVGACLECRIYVPGLDWPLRINEAQVRWVKGDAFGVQFTKIQPDEEVKLKQVIARLDEEFKT